MSNVLPDNLKDEFTQDEWDGLTDAERQGIIEDGEDDGNPTPEELEAQEAADRKREADAAAAAAATQPEQTDAEREAAAAAAAAKPEKTAEELAADAAAAEAEKPAVTPRPRGVVNATLPDDFDQKVAANEKAQDDLEARYENGDISFAEYRKEQRGLDKESRELERIKDRAELAQESSQEALITHWRGIIDPFTKAHPELSASPQAMQEFDNLLKVTTGPVMQAGGMPGQAEVDKAYRMWCVSNGVEPPAPSAKPAASTKQPVKVPPVLGGLPASTATSVEDGKLAAISRLEGVAYEEALAKLTPAEQEQLSMYG